MQNIPAEEPKVGYGYDKAKGGEQAIKLARIRSKQPQEVEEGRVGTQSHGAPVLRDSEEEWWGPISTDYGRLG